MLKIYHWTIRHLGSGQFLWLWCLSFSVVDWTNTPGTKHSEGIFDEVLATALSIQVILQVVEIGKIVRRSSMDCETFDILWFLHIFTACIVGMMSRLVSLTTYPVNAAQDFAGVCPEAHTSSMGLAPSWEPCTIARYCKILLHWFNVWCEKLPIFVPICVSLHCAGATPMDPSNLLLRPPELRA